MNKNNKSQFGERIREERQRLGLSQADAGTLCGVTRETWGKYERGVFEMGSASLQTFLASGADILYILTGQRSLDMQPLKPDEAALLDNYRHSPEDQQRLLRETGAAFAQPKKGKSSAA